MLKTTNLFFIGSSMLLNFILIFFLGGNVESFSLKRPNRRFSFTGKQQIRNDLTYKEKIDSIGGDNFLSSQGLIDIRDMGSRNAMMDEESYTKIVWWDLFKSASSPTVLPNVQSSTLNSMKDDNGPLHSYDILQRDIKVDANKYMTGLSSESIPRLSAWHTLLDLDEKSKLPQSETEKQSQTSINEAASLKRVEEAVVLKAEVNEPVSLKEYLLKGTKLDEKHEAAVVELWNIVKNKGTMRHLNEENIRTVQEALRIAYIALWGRKTARSLEVAINRATGIAAVLGELNASIEVVLAGILHEVFADLRFASQLKLESSSIEGSGVKSQPDEESIALLSDKFGQEVTQLAEKYTRLPRFLAQKTEYTPWQSENQVQMLVLQAEDYSVLYIRLADRLHTLRVLRKLPLEDEEQLKIAQEALFVYAPLAHKMGVMKVKGELEDLSFKVLDPDTFLLTRYTQTAANKAYHDAAEKVQEIISTDPLLRSQNATFRLTYRIKDKYQLYLKMQRKNLRSPNDVRDALGLRIIVDIPQPKSKQQAKGRKTEVDVEEEARLAEEHEKRGRDICYYLVERLRHMPGWEPSKHGFKDYILGAKENGYQSLHQYVRNLALGTNVEVQVRTKEMHLMAELGGAAHWFYKDLIYRKEVAESKIYRIAWRSPQQMAAKSRADLLGMAKKQIQAARVIVYLEDNSTVMNLKKGSTALDAAFTIHTDVGLSTVTIRLNGEPVPFDRVLKTGDVVSVDCAAVTSTPTDSGIVSGAVEQQSRSRVITAKLAWLGMVRTTQAQATLRKHLRESQRGMLVCLGMLQLLAAVSLNKQLISNHYYSNITATSAVRKPTPSSPSSTSTSSKYYLPDAFNLAQRVRDRTDLDIVSYLVLLGTASSSQETATVLARCFEVPAKRLVVPSVNESLLWARSQTQWGWREMFIRNEILRPFLMQILPQLGVEKVSERWAELVGAESLSHITPLSPEYYESIAHSLLSKLRAADNNGNTTVAATSTSSATLTSSEDVSVRPVVVEPVMPVSCTINSPPSSNMVISSASGAYYSLAGSSYPYTHSNNHQENDKDSHNNNFNMNRPLQRRFLRTHKIFVKSQYELAQRPFSLEASLLSDPLRALARRQYADNAMARSPPDIMVE